MRLHLTNALHSDENLVDRDSLRRVLLKESSQQVRVVKHTRATQPGYWRSAERFVGISISFPTKSSMKAMQSGLKSGRRPTTIANSVTPSAQICLSGKRKTSTSAAYVLYGSSLQHSGG